MLKISFFIVLLFTSLTLQAHDGVLLDDFDDTHIALMAAKSALNARHWSVVEEQDNRIVGELSSRGIHALIKIRHEDGRLIYHCDCFRETRRKAANGKYVVTTDEYLPMRWFDYLSDDINNFLDAHPSAKKPRATVSFQKVEKQAEQTPEQRLMKLQSLKDKALITDEEYQSQRQKIIADI